MTSLSARKPIVDNYVDLSDLYVILSDLKLTCHLSILKNMFLPIYVIQLITKISDTSTTLSDKST